MTRVITIEMSDARYREFRNQVREIVDIALFIEADVSINTYEEG